MKVFKMNECDWVAAETQQEAIDWYLKTTGNDYEDAIEDGHPFECPLTTPMKIENLAGGWTRTTFEAEINIHTALHGTEPFLVASTEY